MRLRSLVLPVAAACATVLVAPAPAQAAVECGLIMPTKVVVDGPNLDTPVKLTSACVANDAERASWNLVHESSGIGGTEAWIQDQLSDPYFWRIGWFDTPVGKWVTTPNEARTWGGTDLTQNSSVTWLKYASRLTTTVTRTSSGGLTWAVKATQWSGRSHATVVRPKVTVGAFHQAPGSTTWRYVKSGTTSSTGKATIALGAPRAGKYRLVVAETPTVWASYSAAISVRS